MPKFLVTTTSQVERDYEVLADDEEQAKKRLRVFIQDKDLVMAGKVGYMRERVTTTPRIIAVGEPEPEAQVDREG